MRLLTRNPIEARLPYAEIARSGAGFRFHAGVTSRRKDTQAQEDHNVFGDRLGSPSSGARPWLVRAPCISAAPISAMIPIRISAFRSCAISAAGLVETPTDGHRCILRKLCSRLIFAV